MSQPALREPTFVCETEEDALPPRRPELQLAQGAETQGSQPAETRFAPDPEIWAANGIDMALSCIERVQRTLVRTAQWFHEEQTASANRLFAQCMEGLERFTETMLITRSVLKLGGDTVAVDGYTLTKIETQMENILRSILSCQEKNDTDGIADRIEYALIPNLSLWGQALRQLKRSQTSNA
jgi:hypothetical protein